LVFDCARGRSLEIFGFFYAYRLTYIREPKLFVNMHRRDFVKAIVAVPVTAKTMLAQQAVTHTAAPQATAAAVPQPTEPVIAPTGSSMRGFRPIVSSVADQVAKTEPHFFNDQQLATLRKLSSTLMPPLNGYPGALEAGAPEFIDFLIGISPDDRQEMYRSGLDKLNANAQARFGVPFAHVNAQQADTLLRPSLRVWSTRGFLPSQPPSEPYAHFINVSHQDIRTATMNSQAWSVAATSVGEREPGIDWYWSPIDPDIQR
jgi:Gluconate 2-dehydrogenase subunit 3